METEALGEREEREERNFNKEKGDSQRSLLSEPGLTVWEEQFRPVDTWYWLVTPEPSKERPSSGQKTWRSALARVEC